MDEIESKVVPLFQRKHAQCKGKHSHGPYQVDSKLAEVTCGTCDAKLNPMWVLEELSHSESHYKHRISELKERLEKLDTKLKKQTRVLCSHCRQYTRIKP